MRYIPILIVSLFVIGCREKSKTIREISLEEIASDTLVLEKDQMTKGLGSDFTFIHSDSGQVLLSFNTHHVLFHSYPEGKILKKLKFEKEGPDGIGSYISGSFITDSLIYFLSENKWMRSNFQGQVLERIPLPEASVERLAVNYSTFPFNRIRFSENKFLIADVPFVLKENFLDYNQWIIKFDPASKTQEYIEFKFPKYYRNLLEDQTFSSYNYCFVPEKNEFLISFPGTDSILVISEKVQNWVNASPIEKMEFLVGATEERGDWIVFSPNYKSSKHSWVHYDPYTSKYYRQSIIRPDIGDLQEPGQKPLVKLLVFNEQWEKEYEVILPFASSGFQTPDGFYYQIGYLGSEDQVGYVKLDFSKINP